MFSYPNPLDNGEIEKNMEHGMDTGYVGVFMR